jgi:o-succinylbenzoate---CoA ligase
VYSMSLQNHSLTGKGIWLKNKFVSYSDIQNKDYPKSCTYDELQALDFCYGWLSGTTTFTIHTSGSTGLPKSIHVSRDQMIQSAHLTGQALQLHVGDSALVNLNTSYIGGMMMLVRGLVLGLELWIVPPSLLAFQELCSELHFDFLSFVPMQILAILEKMPDHIAMLNRAKAILIGGAPVSEGLEKQLQLIKSPIYQTYGMTETLSHIALKRINGVEKKDYYTTLPGIEISTDERARLIIRTPFTGPQPIITNDVVQILSQNTFIWLGRIDNIINSGGIKVQAEKIERITEQVLLNSQINRRFFIGALPHSQFGETVTLFMEGDAFSNNDEKKLLHDIAIHTSRFEKPTSVVYISHFIETPSGKIDKIQTIRQYSVS